MAKAQIANDVMIISAAVLVIFLFLFQIYAERAEGVRIFQVQLAAQRIADDVGRSIDHAWLAGNGSIAHAKLPDSLPGTAPYNVSIRDRQVLVIYKAGEGVRIASYVTITGSIAAANFTVAPETGGAALNITNFNGEMAVVEE